jgi:hypothetical protein
LNPHPENEHVGVDEEGMYSEPEVATDDDVSDSNTDSDYESTFDECSSDEEVKNHEPPNKHVFVYDKNDPPMAVGTIYENINVLRFAVAQHSIKHGFEYNIVKSDPGRFRIHCSARKDGCKWRIHASTMGDDVTMKVMFSIRSHTITSSYVAGSEFPFAFLSCR